MSDLSHILIKPIVTEKSMGAVDAGRYTFEVHPEANKSQIKAAVKKFLNVDAVKINVINEKGKFRRFGKTVGRTKDRKKAVVTIKSGQKIELFES
jgi:large subunit ribosomal protein L23